MLRIYYHLYLGPSWKAVWQIHQPTIETWLHRHPASRLVVCVCGPNVPELGLDPALDVEIRHVARQLRGTNEFSTLAELREDSVRADVDFRFGVYLHSKGASSTALSPGATAWTQFLCEALFQGLDDFPRIVEAGYNASGSNLAFGVFEDFAAPRLHYSGNFWCAARELISAARPIEDGSRHASVRHNAEWWLATAQSFRPFNLCATGIDHYAPDAPRWDARRLQARVAALHSDVPPWDESRLVLEFLRSMFVRALGRQPLRAWLARRSDERLPYHRWPRLFNVNHALMSRLGSRKSTYLYCLET